MTTRTYPQGWDRSRFQGAPYAVRGSETDGTARVPFMSRLDAQGGADDAASRTGHPMEVIPEPGAGWSYRPVAEPTPAGVAP